jgi:predicted TIM-barrel fold metal-dependent hydrolase
VHLGDGSVGFLVEGQPLFVGQMNMYAGSTPEDFLPVRLTWDTPGTGSAESRLQEQDIDGVDAEVLFAGIGAASITHLSDDRVHQAMVSAYNAYLADYCAVAPDRLIGVGVIPDRGLEVALSELEHCARLGLKAVCLERFPSGRSYSTSDDDRFWAAAVDIQMPVTIHVTLLRDPSDPAFSFPKRPATPYRVPDSFERMARYGVRGAMSAVQLIVSGVFDRFPRMQVYFAENQIGWIPSFLQEMDHQYVRHRFWAEKLYGWKPLARLPSEYVRGNCHWGFFNDAFGVSVRHYIGVERIMWGSDFPHVETDWPHSAEALEDNFRGVPEPDRHRMVVQNAIDFFHLA